MKTTICLRQLKSGNFELSPLDKCTHTFESAESAFNYVSRKKSTTWDRRNMTFKPARIIKDRYSQSQTYFKSAAELEKYAKI